MAWDPTKKIAPSARTHSDQRRRARNTNSVDRWKLAGKQTYREDRSRLATMVVPHAEWAQLPLDQITRGEVRQWSVDLKTQKHARGKLYGNQSIKHALNLVRGIFAAAIEDELIQTNPAEGVKPPKRRKGEQQDDWTALEPREIKRLLSHPELTYEQRTVFSTWVTERYARSRAAAETFHEPATGFSADVVK
jgi:integrase